MSSLPKPDQVKAPPDDSDHDRAPIHLARELDRVFLDHYVAGNLPLKSRQTAVLQIFLFWGFIASAAALTLAALIAVSRRARLDAELLTYALPGVAGAVVGLRIFHRLTDLQFQRLVNVALIVSCAALALR
jgi:hypothetical protein